MQRIKVIDMSKSRYGQRFYVKVGEYFENEKGKLFKQNKAGINIVFNCTYKKDNALTRHYYSNNIIGYSDSGKLWKWV